MMLGIPSFGGCVPLPPRNGDPPVVPPGRGEGLALHVPPPRGDHRGVVPRPSREGAGGGSVWQERTPCIAPNLAALVLVVIPVWLVAGRVSCAAPVVETAADRVTVRTAHYVATFDQGAGSLLTALRTADRTPLITGSRIYHDHMMRCPRKAYRATSANPPQARAVDGGQRVVVEAEGRLLDDAGKPHEIGDFSYLVRYTFDDAPKLRIATTITVGFDEPELSGFLAHLFSTAPQREFFANTTDGRVCELAATRSQRTWQSVREPLSLSAAWLGCVLKSGRVLRFSITGRSQPLQNVFFHDSGRGPTTIFFAWLDGGTTRPVKRGTKWELEVEVEAVALGEFGE